MVLAKSKKNAGLGNALMNDRFKKGKGSDRRRGSAITRTNHATGEQYVTNDHKEAGWVKMRSVTEQGALEEFLATAQLAGTDFTAQKMNNVRIIHTDQKNPYLLTAAEERLSLERQKEHSNRLTVPRRPHWDASTTPEELDALERESFLLWRRGLAELQDNQDLLMTPFERNLEVWRQMWRVIERSDLVVQIVDARNPLLFRSADLEDYVKDVDPAKENLLLINKADMMTLRQRRAWADYLKAAKIPYKFFSAHLAKERNEQRELEGSDDESEEESAATKTTAKKEENVSEGHDGADDTLDTKILTVEELEELFLRHSPKGGSDNPDRKLQIGLVGYPNVGKSSTINALIGAKKVSVSSTPGKTKHFQTIHLSEKVILCDCPGLVFPNFATTKGDLVCNGILPIDQLREFSGPAGLVARRIPQSFLENVYGIRIRTRPLEEGGTGIPTAEELLMAYARARGFTKSGQGQPDESRAARYILKDYVNGKLLYCEPPPPLSTLTGDVISESDSSLAAAEFNRELYDLAHLPERRRQALTKSMAALSTVDDDSEGGEAYEEEDENDGDNGDEDSDSASSGDSDVEGGAPALAADVVPLSTAAATTPGAKSRRLDEEFFKTLPPPRHAGHLNMPFSHQYTEQGRAAVETGGRQLSGRKARLMMALESGLDPKDVQMMSNKKHFKGGAKTRGKKKTPSNAEDP